MEASKARCVGLESSLAAAKEEARHLVKHAEKQAAQLTSAQDGFKVSNIGFCALDPKVPLFDQEFFIYHNPFLILDSGSTDSTHDDHPLDGRNVLGRCRFTFPRSSTFLQWRGIILF